MLIDPPNKANAQENTKIFPGRRTTCSGPPKVTLTNGGDLVGLLQHPFLPGVKGSDTVPGAALLDPAPARRALGLRPDPNATPCMGAAALCQGSS